jgi:CCR4-NOT transcription complex subunit 2
MPENSWAQQAQQSMGSRTTPLDFSATSFPSLNNNGGQAQAQNASSSAWQGGPPQPSEASRRQPLQSRTLGSRQQQTQASDFYSADNRTSTLATGPPGLVQRQNQLSDSNDPSRVTSPSGHAADTRSPIGQNLNGTIGQERPLGESSPSSQQPRDPFGGRDAFEHNPDSTPDAAYAGLSEKDKFGMKGYLALSEGPNPTFRSLARGQDLGQLGLNMSSEPSLLQSYTGPFASPTTHPLRPLDSEFHIPDCYTVKKVAPLNQRINSFSDETLFYMFYSMPRDYMQVLVAQELMERKWRYHMHEQMWMMRDENSGGYAYNDDRSSEQGYYIWWDKNVWKKVRRAYTLRYADLDDMPNMNGQVTAGRGAGARGPAAGLGAGLNGSIGGAALTGSAFNAVPGLERLAAAGRGF